MQLPKNRFQILILHNKKHSYIQYKEINIHFLMPINWKNSLLEKGNCQKVKTDRKIFILEALIRRP